MQGAAAAAGSEDGREGPRGHADEVGGEEGVPRGAAAAALLAAAAPARGAEAVYEYSLVTRRARRAPEFAGAAGARSCSVGHPLVAFADARGVVLSAGNNMQGEHGAGDRMHREGHIAARLPWPAAAVRSGLRYSVAVRRGGAAVCSWALDFRRSDDFALPADLQPAELQGLPVGDPIALLDAGIMGVVAVTASGVALSWDRPRYFGQMAHTDGLAAAPIAALTGRRLRSLAFGGSVVMAETDDGVLLCWLWGRPDATQAPQPQPPDEVPAFPLRCLVAGFVYFACADAVGRVWWLEDHRPVVYRQRALLPEAQRAVRLAAAASVHFDFVALTERGELWDCSVGGPCRSISAAQPELPRGLLPYGGSTARRILLVPDSSGGKARLALFARIAMRVGIPADPVRELLPPFVVHEAYITGPASDPFGCPIVRA